MKELLCTLYPAYPWDASRFHHVHNPLQAPVPHGHWMSQMNLLNALNRAEEKLGIKQVGAEYLDTTIQSI